MLAAPMLCCCACVTNQGNQAPLTRELCILTAENMFDGPDRSSFQTECPQPDDDFPVYCRRDKIAEGRGRASSYESPQVPMVISVFSSYLHLVIAV